MDLGLRDKKVLVTGSTAGIGFASAKLFAKEGAEVWINGRTAERTNAAIEAITKEVAGAKLHAATGDVGNAKGIEAIEKAAPEIDVLVNNAGIFEPKPFEEIPDEDWMRFFETNVLSGIRLSRKYLAGMLKKNWGRILFISSESGLQIPVEMIHYGTTKTAQLAVARGLAERCVGTGVTVNSVLPGPTKSEGVGGFVKALAAQGKTTEAKVEEDFFKTARPSSILQRFISIDEVASMIVYVASEAASATTGASIRVDGGVVRSIA